MKRLMLATVSLAAIATPALAQEDEIVIQAQRENASAVTGEGDLGALGDKKTEDVPFVVRSYNEAIILNQQPLTLGALLENDPTIRTSYGFGNASEQFVIRGFQLFGDDVGLNGLYGIAPRQLIAPELFQSVQVLNGASAFLNGAAPGGSGIGGSVNLQLKRADRDLTRATASYIGDQHFGGSFDVARRFGDGSFGVRVNGAFRSGDVAIEGEFRRTAVLGAAFDWRGERVRASLDLGYQRVEVDGLRPKVTIGTTVIPRVPEADANYAQPWTYTDMRDVFGVARIEYDVGDNALLYATAGARDGMEEGIYSGLTVLDATTGAANGNALYVPRTDNNEAIEAGLRVKLGQAVTHEVNFGGNIAWLTNRNAFDFLYGPGFAGFDTNLYDTPVAAIPSSTLVGGNLDEPFPISKTRLWSVFASDTIGLFDNRLLVTGGLRLQSIRVQTFNAYNGGLLDSVYEENAVTPVVGVVVKPVAGVSLFANRIEGLQQGPTAPIDPILVNPGEVFAPTKSVQYEVGGKIAIGGFDASLALFQIDLPSAYAVPTGSGGQQVYGLFGKQRNRGIELSFAGEVAPGLRLIGGGTVVDAKLRETLGGANEGNRAQGVPEYTANLNAEWDLGFVPGLTLTGRVVHTGPQAVNVANTLELDDWTRVDLGARYVFAAGDKPLTLRVGVDNVANARYWASAYDAFNQALLQGAPRTVRASLSVDF
ncbi:TonB-dependent receptor [Sphingomonas sp. ST-64]|uniref:TonB-dependent receptor n=1 Tax=Sphingomonas plantiphila TaxID=3163295 RepID=A0ABW8YN23_9SPHN